MTSARAWASRGQANLLMKENFTAEAESVYRSAMAISPNSSEPVFGLMEILNQSGRQNETLTLLLDICKKHPAQQPAFQPIIDSLTNHR